MSRPAPARPRPTRHAEAPGELLDPRYARLVGGPAWGALPAAVRRRFAKRLGPGDAALFRGRVVHTRLNRAGWLLARALRVAGAPLPLDRDNEGAAATVCVSEDAHGSGQFWLRQYGRTGRDFPQVVRSTKRFAGPTGCEEWVTRWLGMSLRVEATPNGLHFHSERYLLRVLGRRVGLPHWMTPGRLVVGHTNHVDDTFDFTLHLAHPWLGTLLDQRIRFCDQRDAQPLEVLPPETLPSEARP